MNDELTPTQQHSSRPMQFGLLALLGFVTAIAVLIAAFIAKSRDGEATLSHGMIVLTILTLGFLAVRFRWNIPASICGIGVTALAAYSMFDPLFMRAARVPPPRNPCAMRAKQLGIAIKNYHDAYKTLPPIYLTDSQGKPLHSWRTLILPFIEEGNLYKQFRLDEPWNSPHNIEVSQKYLDMFHCPNDKGAGSFDTSYVAVVGSDTAWNTKRRKLAFKDGGADTILLIEMKNTSIAWAEPRDLDLSNLPPGITKTNLLHSLSNHHIGGFHALFADGHVELIPSTIPWSQFEALLTKSGDETIDRSTW